MQVWRPLLSQKKLGGEHRNAASCSDCDSGNKKLFHSALYHSNKFYVSILLRMKPYLYGEQSAPNIAERVRDKVLLEHLITD